MTEHVYVIEKGDVDHEDEALCSVWTNLDDALVAASDTAKAIIEEISDDTHHYTVQLTMPRDHQFLFTIMWDPKDGDPRETDWWRVRRMELKGSYIRDPNDPAL